MKKFKFALSTIWFYLFMAFACVLLSNLSLLTGNPDPQIELNTFILLTTLTMFTFVIYVISEHKRNKMPIDWVLAPILLLLLGISILGIWSIGSEISIFNPTTNKTSITGFSNLDKIKYTVEAVILYATIYVSIFVYSRGLLKSSKIAWIPVCVVIVSLTLCGISIFVDSEFYFGLIHGFSSDQISGAASIFYNENTFGFSTLIGLICSLVVLYQKRHWYWMWIVTFILFAFICFSTSVTSIMAAVIALMAYSIIQIIFAFVHRHNVRGILGLTSMLLIVGGVVAFLGIGTYMNLPIAVKAMHFIQKDFFGKDFGSFSNRKDIWQAAIDLATRNPFRLLFGYGYGTSMDIFGGYSITVSKLSNLSTTHSGYLQILVDGGLITFCVYMFCILYFFYSCLRLMIRKHGHMPLTYMTFVISILIHGFYESTYFFAPSAFGMVATVLVFLPPIVAWKQMRHKEIKESVNAQYAMPSQGVKCESYVSLVMLALKVIFFGFAILFMNPITYATPWMVKGLIGVLIFLAISMIFVPYLTFNWYKKATLGRFVFRIITYIIVILGASIGGAYFAYLKLANIELSVLIGLGIYFVSLMICNTIYAAARKGSFKEWAKSTAKGIFVNNFGGCATGTVVGALTFIFVTAFVPMDMVGTAVLAVTCIELYLVCYLLFPSKTKDDMLNDFNEEELVRLKRLAFKEEL